MSARSAMIIPALRYRDAPASIDWLCAAFDFEKHLVVPGSAGKIDADGKMGQIAIELPIARAGNSIANQGITRSDWPALMHVSLPIGSSVLMGSDSCSAFGPPPVAGNNFSISIVGQSKEHCDEMFAKL